MGRLRGRNFWILAIVGISILVAMAVITIAVNRPDIGIGWAWADIVGGILAIALIVRFALRDGSGSP